MRMACSCRQHLTSISGTCKEMSSPIECRQPSRGCNALERHTNLVAFVLSEIYLCLFILHWQPHGPPWRLCLSVKQYPSSSEHGSRCRLRTACALLQIKAEGCKQRGWNMSSCSCKAVGSPGEPHAAHFRWSSRQLSESEALTQINKSCELVECSFVTI